MALSADDEAQLTIDSLLEDVDLEEDITLEELNEIIKPFTEQLSALLDRLVSSLE